MGKPLEFQGILFSSRVLGLFRFLCPFRTWATLAVFLFHFFFYLYFCCNVDFCFLFVIEYVIMWL